MSDLDGELEISLNAVTEAKEDFSEDEQNIIDAWIAKLSEPKETDEEKAIINEYARTLAKLTQIEKKLLPPFTELPPDDELIPLLTDSPPKKVGFPIVRLPCISARAPNSPISKGAIPKQKKFDAADDFELSKNEFEDFEEMAKIIARSKGQSFAEFVVAISRHTVDYGKQLRSAMKTETTTFKEYVEHVLSQRIKDLTEVLDVEQNSELQKIKKDIDKWQVELSHCKKRVREMIPDFDMDAYKRDKLYLKKVFAVNEGPGSPEDDNFKNWKEEACHRMKWYSDKISILTECNEQMKQDVSEMNAKTLDFEAKEALKQQNQVQFIRCELAEYHKLKHERDRLNKENTELSAQLDEEGG